MDGFERRKARSREKILNAANLLFTKYGIDKVRVDEIARKAGVSKVTIYHLFGSKDKLLHDCMEITGDRIIKDIREITKVDKSYLEKMEDIFQYLIDMTEASPGYSDIEARYTPQMRQLAEKLAEQVIGLFVEFVKEGQRQGHLNPGLSDEAIRSYFKIFIQGVNANPDLHARMHYDPKMLHDMLLIMMYGFARVK